MSIPTDSPVWDRFFTVAPLVIAGSREGGGGYDLAPKHMAMPLGWQNYSLKSPARVDHAADHAARPR